GFIISNEGSILTNTHVGADADEILVRLSDRSEHKAKLVGADPRSDVAVLKIGGKKFPPLKPGDSRELKVGEWVLAIGSSFGF
ncbi:S1C family serine protease, partial [Pseudomonas aeruginosa]